MSKVQKPRLGRGLSSLISVSDVPIQVEVAEHDVHVDSQGDVAEAAVAIAPLPLSPSSRPAVSGGVAELPVEQIHPNPHQPRRLIDESKVAELAASIKSTGIIQPVVVRQVGDSYQLIAGERRWRAARHAGLPTVPAIVRDATSFEQAQMALVENIQREDLNPMDRASSYRTLMDQLGLTQAELAARLGEERSSVANYVRLLDLAAPVRELVRQGKLSLGHAKLLAGLSDIVEQQRLAELTVSQELSVRNLERAIAGGNESAEPAREASPPAPTSAHLRDLEQSLSRQLGLRVQVRTGAKKSRGKLILHYATLDEFDMLLGRLGVTSD